MLLLRTKIASKENKKNKKKKCLKTTTTFTRTITVLLQVPLNLTIL